MSCTITYKGQKYSEEQFKEYFINNKNEFVTSISKNKDVIDSFKRKVEGHTTLEEFKKQKEDRIKELEKKLSALENDGVQGAYDFGASSNSGKWNSANNELLVLVQDNRKAFAIYKFLIGDMETFKEIIDFLNERGIEIPYTDRMRRADETMTAAERKSAIDSYNNSVNSKVEDKVQVEKDILSENNLQDETEYTPQELIENYPLTGVQKVIWNLIKDIVNKLGIKVKFSSSRITEGFDGSNNPQNGEILIRPSTLKNGRFGEVLVHEVVHALTTKIISRVNSGVTTGLTQKQITAVKGLMKLFEAVKADNNLENKYPIKDVFEFIAHLTNEVFVKELESKDKSFLQKVVDFILDIFGISNANELSKKYLLDIISDGVFLQENGITVLPSDYGNNIQGSKSEEVQKIKNEINQLKQELERVDREGFGALRPIFNFYENTVTNILKKQGYNPTLITDEYGNTWNEVLPAKSVILFQKTSKSNKTSNINSELDNKLKDYIQSAGIDIQIVDSIKDRFGNSANAVVNFIDKTLKLVEGKIAEDTLPEEAAHIYTLILRDKDPYLYQKMLEEIIKYPEYKEVKEDYSNTYNYEDEFRIEAVGKLIAKRILNKGKETPTFFKAAWNRIKEILGKFFDISSEVFEDMFDIAADNIVNGTSVYKAPTTNSKFYQISSFNWNSIVNKITDTANKLEKRLELDEEGQERDFYYHKGLAKEIKYRVTQLVKGNKKHHKQFTPEQQESNKKKAEFGTKGHATIEGIIKRFLDIKTNISKEQYTPISKLVNADITTSLVKYIEPILNNPLFEGATFLTEVKVYDENRDLAGTIDLLILDKNGYAHIFDWKFMGDKRVPKYRKEEFNKQVSLYKQILKTYGIEKFGMLRIVPITTEYDAESKPLKLSVDGVDIYNNIIPSEEEITDNENLNKLINKLYLEAKTLRENQKITYRDKEDRLRAIEQSINLIKVRKDLKLFKNYIKNILDTIEEELESESLSTDRMAEIFKVIGYYGDIDKVLQIEELSDVALRARSIDLKLPSLLKQFADKTGVSQEYYRPVDSLLHEATSLGSINNPIFRKLNELTQNAMSSRDNKVNSFIQKIKDLKIDSAKLLAKRGNTWALIPKFNKDFYEKIKNASATWIIDNVTIKDKVVVNGEYLDAKEHFESELIRKSELFRKFNPETAEQEIDIFRKYNDFWSDKYKHIALANFATGGGRNFYVRPSDKWYSDEYKELLSNPTSDNAVFYNEVQALIEEANNYTGERLNERFIPFIEKSLISKVFSGDFGLNQALEHLKSDLSLKEYDVTKDDKALRIKYLQEMSADNQSTDLKQIFTMFANSVYDVKYKSEIESEVYMLSKILQGAKYIQLTNTGNAVKRDGVIQFDISTTDGYDNKTLKTFNKFSDMLLYDVKDRSDINVGGISGAKLLEKALSHNSFLRIGLNTLSATANWFGGNANLIIEAFKGKFFDTKDLANAKKLFWSRNPKAMALIHYFDSATDNNIYRKSREISSSKLDKIFTPDWIMKLQDIGEKEVQYSVLLAYLEGMTIKDSKLVRKSEGDKSIIDMIEIKDDNIILPELTESIYNKIRLASMDLSTKLTGARSDRSRMLYQNYGYMRALTQFKGWVFPMAKERFGSLNYNSNLSTYEEGRYSQMFKAIVNKHTLENFIPLLKGLVTFNARAVTLGVDKALRQMYENYLEVNPNFKEGEDALSFEEYQRLFEHNIKAMLGELVLLVGLTGSMLALSNGTDDEDKDKKGILLVMDRFYNELTYFYNIQSYLDMGGISVPLINTASDVGKFMTEVLDNVWGITTNNSELISKEDLWKKGSKITIGLRQYDNIQKLIDNYGY